MVSALASLLVAFGVAGGHVTANGAPAFPVLAYWQCGESARQAASAGVDFFVQQPYTACSPLRPNDFAADPPPPGVHVLSDDYADAAPDGGWYLPDEPDALGLTAAELPRLPSGTGRLRVVNVSQHFYSGQELIRPGYDRGEYGRFAGAGDLLGFDLYPIVKFCGRVPLLDVFRAQRELATRYAPVTATFQWIETGRMTGECPTLEITPAIANAEAWLAVAGGAAGIGWFTASWTAGAPWQRWNVDAPMLAQMTETDARLHELAPMLAETWSPVASPASIAAGARGGSIIAVNWTAAPVTAALRAPGLGRGALSVLWENRSVRADRRGVFHDGFAPYAVHVYVRR